MLLYKQAKNLQAVAQSVSWIRQGLRPAMECKRLIKTVKPDLRNLQTFFNNLLFQTFATIIGMIQIHVELVNVGVMFVRIQFYLFSV